MSFEWLSTSIIFSSSTAIPKFSKTVLSGATGRRYFGNRSVVLLDVFGIEPRLHRLISITMYSIRIC